MNGVHDMGGMHGFGPVVREEQEPVFHEPWEGRVQGMRMALGPDIARLGGFRYAIEQLDPVFYLEAPYYARHLEAVIRLCIEKGLISREEFEARVQRFADEPAAPVPEVRDPAKAEQVMARLLKFPVVRKDVAEPPAFRPGDAVRVRNLHPRGHIRLPRYLRGKAGVIERYNGYFDVHDHEHRDDPLPPPEPLYSVSFDMKELWGEAAEPGRVVADLAESYLEQPEGRA